MAQQVEIPGVGIAEFPDGMSQADIAAAIKKSYPKLGQPAQPKAEGPSALSRFGSGIADSLYGGVQSVLHNNSLISPPLAAFNAVKTALTKAGVKQADAKDVDKFLQERETTLQNGRQGAMPIDPATGKPQEPGVDWARMGGNVTSMLPFAMGSAGANAPGLLGKMLGGAYDSIVPGLLSPVTNKSDYGDEKRKQLLLSGVTGAVLPGVAQAAPAVKALIEPFSKGGQNKIVGRAMNRAAGNYADDAIYNLQNAKELVPGSVPTAGQAAGNAGIAALERTATATDPVAMNEMARRLAAQNEARITALKGAAPDRDAAVTARQQMADALYASADPKPIAITPELQALMQRPSMQSAVSDAQRLAMEKGGKLDPMAMTGQDAHYIKRALDDITNAPPQQGFGQNQIGAVRDTKSAFLDQIERQIPEYGQARQSFAEMSKPVNQADIVEGIANKATNFRGDITPAAYAKALNDNTAKSVTGQHNATLDAIMAPEQMQTLQSIKDDLLRADFANTAGKGVGSDTVQKLAYDNMLSQSGIPSAVKNVPGAGIIGRVADFGYKRSNEDMRQALAQALLDPKMTGELMQNAMPSESAKIISQILRSSAPVVGATAYPMLQGNQ